MVHKMQRALISIRDSDTLYKSEFRNFQIIAPS